MSDSKSATADVGGKRSHWSLLGSALGPFLALGVVVAFFAIADGMQENGGAFSTIRNFRTISAQTATVAVAALGMTVVIIAGGIDLSAGTALALCATVLAWSLKEDVAVLVVHGENVAGATRSLEEAEAELGSLDSKIARAGKRGARGARTAERLQGERKAIEANLPTLREQLQDVQAATASLNVYTPALALLLGVGTGCLAGFVNGFLVSYLRVVPFIVTLGTMRFFLGVAKEVGSETTVRPHQTEQVPEWLGSFTSIQNKALVLGLPSGVWLALALAVVLSAVLRYTVFGRYVFALGSNEATARLCGVNVRRMKIAVYMLCGFFIGIAGLYQFSRLSVGNPTSGLGMELEVIAAVVIGGGSLSGGRGSVLGTLTGAAIMAVIQSGCTQLGLKNPVQDMILGGIIVAAVAVDQIRQRRLAE